MKNYSFKAMLLAFYTLMIAIAQIANASSSCPSDIAKPFVGKWQGQALLIPANAAQLQSATQAEYVIIDCQTFGATFNYLDDNGNIVRTIKFKASPDPEQVGLFDIINGTTTDKSGVTEVKGSFRQIQNGTLLGTFLGSLESKPVYMTELMNVTEPQNGISQLLISS